MSLSERINDKFEEWRQNVSDGLAGFIVTVTGKGIELVLDIVGKAIKPVMMPTINKLLDQPDLPSEVRDILTQVKTTDGQWQAILLSGMAGTAVGGAANSALLPPLELLKQSMSRKTPFQVFDIPFVLAIWLRELLPDFDVFLDLESQGWDKNRIEVLKQLVWLRLDPLIVQQIWLRDKTLYEPLWKDLHDVGWDDERIAVYKELAHILPPAPDLIRMAVREVFTPEIVEQYGQMEDFPPDFAQWSEKVGLTEFWARNYWAAHWDLPSPTQGFEMLHRGVITYDELKVLLRAQDVMPYWRDKLVQIAYSPYTRVDVRRMYKEEVLDEAGVKRAYMDLGYDEERADKLTEFTLKHYGRDEDAVEDEEEKIRELTRADICDGYRRGILSNLEARDLLSKLAYTDVAIDFYIDREDYKKQKELRDAYAVNYRQLFVIGLKDAGTVKTEMMALGFLAGEIDEYLRVWAIEKLRRTSRPSRADLARFLRKEIITEAIWRQGMADLGYADKYIEWYLSDIRTE